MRQEFNPEIQDIWSRYFEDQASQVGYGMDGFKGTLYQRGAGLGSFFRSLFRLAVPVFRRAASSVGKQALATGADIAKDYLDGQPILAAAETRGREGLAELANKAGVAIRQQGRGLGTRPRKSIDAAHPDIFRNKTKRLKHVAR